MPPRAPAPQRGFEDFRVGEVFRAPSRTHSETLFHAFRIAATGAGPVRRRSMEKG